MNKYKKRYTYNNPETNQSSGVTTYAPSRYFKEIPYRSELPPPTVMYKYVTVENMSINNEVSNKTVFEFNVPDGYTFDGDNFTMDDFLSITVLQDDTQEDVDVQGEVLGMNSTLHKRKYELKNNTSSIGQLVSKKEYNSFGHLLSDTQNKYKTIADLDQGIHRETYAAYKSVQHNITEGKQYQLSLSSKVNYPSVLEEVTTVASGLSQSEKYINFDFNTGNILESEKTLSNGTVLKSKIIPAYTKYADMGSKVDNDQNHNMLVQETAQYRYIKDDNGTWKPIDVAATTWSDQWSVVDPLTGNAITNNVWRTAKEYVWKGDLNEDGSLSGFVDFDWNTTNLNQGWQNTTETTKYTAYSKAIEAKNINDNYATTIFDKHKEKVIAMIDNSKASEVAFSGAEFTPLGSQFQIGQLTTNPSDCHSGKQAVTVNTLNALSGFKVTFDGSHQSGMYKISVWCKNSNVANARININGTSKLFNGEQVSAGDWTMLNHYETLNGSNGEIVYVASNSGTVIYDDFRIHPINATMTSYLYNEYDELSYIFDNNNLGSYFEYDAVGRLTDTYSEAIDEPNIQVIGGFKKVKTIKYNHGESLGDGTTNDPFITYVTYGTASNNAQEFIATATGGTGTYQYKWYKGIGNSSSNFETTVASTASSYTLNVSCNDIRWVKVEITSGTETQFRIVRNNNACDGDTTGGGQNE